MIIGKVRSMKSIGLRFLKVMPNNHSAILPTKSIKNKDLSSLPSKLLLMGNKIANKTVRSS